MAFHLYRALNDGQAPRWFGVRIEYVDDRWVSTCNEVDADGLEQVGGAQVVPRFYGVTAEQAHRRMVDALENTYDEVASATRGDSS